MEQGSGLAYVQEFIAISSFLASTDRVIKKKGYISVQKEILVRLLEKNAYDTPNGKLQVWKRLHWISTDPERYTKKISYDGKRIRVIQIDKTVSETLAELFKTPGQST